MAKICELEGCNKLARRKFCSNKHKDRYHNMHNPRGWGLLLEDLDGRTPDDIDEGPEGWDGHKDN